MEKVYRHRKTGELAYYKDGVMQVCRTVIEGEPNLDFWEEVIDI